MPTDVPIGTMLPYAGNKIPAGWLACDNAAYPTTTYPQLYAAIGFTYGMDGSNYRVPDTRGVFMRGMDATATRDTNRPAGSIQLSGTVPDPTSVFTGASASATGGVGYVPVPLAGQDKYYLSGGGSWAKLGLGLTGETWRDVKSARVLNTDYPIVLLTYPLQVSITFNISNHMSGHLYVDGMLLSKFQNTTQSSIIFTASGVVPAGSRYRFACSTTIIDVWLELY